jgi:hypothetical protein
VEPQLGLFPTFEEVLNSFQYGVGFMRLHPQLGKVGKTFLQPGKRSKLPPNFTRLIDSVGFMSSGQPDCGEREYQVARLC